jgi:hypothetical protein
MKIPTSFKLGGHTLTVKMVTEDEIFKIARDNHVYGIFIPDSLTIYLQKPTRRLKASVVQQTFWHELSHAILWVMNHKDYSNEKMVDQMGHLLHQFHQTKSNQ